MCVENRFSQLKSSQFFSIISSQPLNTREKKNQIIQKKEIGFNDRDVTIDFFLRRFELRESIYVFDGPTTL